MWFVADVWTSRCDHMMSIRLRVMCKDVIKNKGNLPKGAGILELK